MSKKEYMYILAKAQISSLRIHLCASERSERAIFGVFNSFTVKKVSFFTINVKFKVTLSSKSGGMFVQAIPPPPPKKVGGYISPIPPPPPRIYASGLTIFTLSSEIELNLLWSSSLIFHVMSLKIILFFFFLLIK